MGPVRRARSNDGLAAADRRDGRRHARPLEPGVSWTFLACTLTLAAVYGAGVLGEAIYPLMLAGSCIGVLVGVRHNRPAVRWHWWAFISSLLLWAAAGAAREQVEATGVLDSSRSFLPDVFALPAYIALAVALSGLLRAQRTGAPSDRGAWLDSAVVALAALLLAWIFALGPQLSTKDPWLPAAIAIAIYPPMSALLVAISCRLAFGVSPRSPSHQMVFAGTVFLLVGDIVFAMEEVGALSVGRVFELPFLIAAALLGGAALHPSMRHLNRPMTRRTGMLTRARIATLAVALLLPSLIVAVLPRSSTAARVFLGAILVGLALTATLRLVFTLLDQSRFEARLVYQATHDELTGLPNRTRALTHIEECLRRTGDAGPPSLAVMFADVDEFKLVNDSMGHAIGDELLVAAALRLTATVREEDFVARISGDEFLIVCQGVDVAAAHAIAQRVRFAFNQPFELSSGRVYATTSIGVAMNDAGTTAAGIVRDADTAMYRSKFTGRDSITFFDVAMRERVERRVALERMLRVALERGEIVAHFQPIVGLPAGQVEGFEVLARWHHADGRIHPAEFVPVAEESGLIVPLGATILDQACRQLAIWRRELPGAEQAYVSVNLSPRQIFESDIVDTISEVLERWELPGSALWLEITESVMLEDTVETQAVLHALRQLGVCLSMDDFGTGFSSLSYLKKYPVSRVKIDKMFVDGLDEADADDSIVAAIIAMATALGLTTIAEGVERGSQASRLFQLGCTGAQGHYFAEALDPSDVPGVVLPLGFTPRARQPERRNDDHPDGRAGRHAGPTTP